LTFKPFGASNTSCTGAVGGLDLTDTDDPADAAARLEEALERIATLADQVAADRARGPVPDQAVNAAVVAERLDALIARLRMALSGLPG
jgi:hypothetical protein